MNVCIVFLPRNAHTNITINMHTLRSNYRIDDINDDNDDDNDADDLM